MEYKSEDFLKLLKKSVTDEKFRHKYYKSCCEHREDMGVHVYGEKPKKLLDRIRPREDEAIKKYRIDSYEPTTKAICGKALSITGKIFNPKLYSIRFSDTKDGSLGRKQEELKKYTTEDYPRFNSVVGYLSKYAFKKMIADPNGIFLVQPDNYNIPSNQRVKPVITCYQSDDIWHIDSDSALVLVEKNDSDKERYWVFQFADKQQIINIKYFTNNGTDYYITELSKYVHNFGELPIWFLGGDYSDKQDGIYQSFFYDAVPFWNMAISDESDVVGAYRNHLHPKLWEYVEDCDYLEDGRYPCIGGQINHPDGKHSCSSCGGSGKRTPKSPYETYQVSKGAFTNENVTSVQIPFGYVTVPTDATKLLEERSKYNLMRGLEALSMDVVAKIGENQSGIAKAYDRTELFDFLQKIADQVFDVHLKNIFYYFVKYMFSVDTPNPESLSKIEPEISKPTEFDVFSISDLTQQLKDAKESSLNPTYTKTLQVEIQNKKFQTHPDLLDRLNQITILDPLAEFSDDDINLKMQRNTVTKESVIIHDNIEHFISVAYSKNDSFSELNYEEKMKVLTKMATDFDKAARKKIDTSAIEGGGGDIDTPVDVEAAAKANLKGSVGGVQGLIQIQTSVAQGITDYEAAVTMLFEIYGFDDSIARKLLGDKDKLESTNDTGANSGARGQNSSSKPSSDNEPNDQD